MTRSGINRELVWAARCVLLAVVLWQPSAIQADQAEYVYDELGRLVRVIDGQGNVATWTYDAAGNILPGDRSTARQIPPPGSAITPNSGPAGSAGYSTL